MMQSHSGRWQNFIQEVIDLREEDGYPEDEAIILASESYGISPVEGARIWEKDRDR